MNNNTTYLNKRLKFAEELHSSINNEIEFLHEQINILNARLVGKKSELANAQYEVTRIVKEMQTAERFAQA
jgi:hypothetical protein